MCAGNRPFCSIPEQEHGHVFFLLASASVWYGGIGFSRLFVYISCPMIKCVCVVRHTVAADAITQSPVIIVCVCLHLKAYNPLKRKHSIVCYCCCCYSFFSIGNDKFQWHRRVKQRGHMKQEKRRKKNGQLTNR